MAEQHPAPDTQLAAPGVPVIRNINWGGLSTLYVKEVRRFFKVQLQTIWAPAVSQLLLLVVFTTALGARGEVSVGGVNVPFGTFIAPGLVVMGMLNNAFANSSFSLLVGKIQGTIVDYLMPPLSTGELLAALCGGAVTRAFCVGGAVWLAMLLFLGSVMVPQHLFAVLWFGLFGSLMLAFLGVITSIWGEKFDHAAAVTNFVIAPLTLLSGTFYSVDRLSPAFQTISHFNPFFYVISGFRYGFLGVSDGYVSIWTAGGIVVAIDAVLGVVCYLLLRSGWKIKS
ncbi:ABC transporter permease [Sphingomonas sp. MG17]|jgi:ABC-2 type transport system permease protein|uniref:Transport permease protein n=1 Tax=Sphingomonas tagetis TaxID=2949092 RepID=A0A9X2KL68_9SPHN|nr:ABC transporter permease [Sphingomonas tagetis]MCP3730106.1 ABC transporter permease [Sphingomonas tagetis]